MHHTTPSTLIDRLIQYNYKSLHIRYQETARNKAEARLQRDIKSPKLRSKVNFQYKRINTEGIPLVWTKIWNILSLKGKKCRASHHKHSTNHITDMEHMLNTLEECGFRNIISMLYKYTSTDIPDDNSKKDLYTIHNLLLSII